MTFQILTPTKARLDDVRVLSQKNRQPDENPGVQLPMSMKLSNHILASIDPSLKPFLFTAATAGNEPTATKRKDNSTGTLDGVEPVTDLPKLSGIGAHVKTLPWQGEISAVKLGLAFATTNLPLDDCRIHRMRIKPQDGGTVELKFVVDAPNASEAVFAKLAKYKSREVDVTVEQHEPAQQEIDDPVKPAPAHKPGAAERAAAGVKPTAKHKEPTKAEARKTAEEAFAAAPAAKLSDEAAWPFPQSGRADGSPPPQSVTTEATTRSPAGSRTARGREKTAAALAAGAKA